ncbi:MAG: hypothetical protein HGA65_05565 [Oscillochloris sp.]|nr:hypothetical protein [Oscillochloris sp.]
MRQQATEAHLRQRVGRRLGVRPYYRIVEQNDGRLVLDSLPGANRRAGYQVLAGGIVITLVAVMIIGSGIVNSLQGGGFGVAAISAAVAGLLGNIGMRRMIGGYAILTTRNQITADANAGEISFSQRSRIGKPLSQRLQLSQIDSLRLRRRPFVVGSILRRMRQIVVIELLVGESVWVVDSAENDGDLQPLAVALNELIAA